MQFMSVKLPNMVSFIVHLFLTVMLPFQIQKIYSDHILEEFVWFEKTFRENNRNLDEKLCQETSSILDVEQEKMYQTKEKEKNYSKKLDDDIYKLGLSCAKVNSSLTSYAR